MNKKPTIFAFLFFLIFFLGLTAQEKDKEMIRLEKESMRIQAEAVTSGYIIFVDAATGDDTKGEGTAKKPYKTLNRALKAALSGDTIKVGPGVYSENLNINTLDRITFEGAGSDVCTINGYLYTLGCKYLRITGLKFTGSEGWEGLWCDNTDVAVVRDCVFEILGGIGIALEHNSAMWVNNSQLSCADGNGAVAHSFSYLYLQNCTVSGNWIGIVSKRGALTYIINCQVQENWDSGILVEQNAQFYMDYGSIHNNGIGVYARKGGVVDDYTNNKIFNNSLTGILLETGGQAELRGVEIYNNPEGIRATQGSILKLNNGRPIIIHDNVIGIWVQEFAHAFLGNTPISGNGIDVNIGGGGQASCDSSLINTIVSDCPYCQK